MSKRNKIIIAVFADIILLISFICFFGFVIGGAMSLITYIAFALFSVVCAVLTLLFTDSKAFYKSKKLKEITFIIAFVMFFICCGLYPNMNTLSAGEVEVEYESEILNAYTPKGGISGYIVVEDENGNTVEIADYYPSSIFDEYGDIVKKAHIKKRMGGFGYPIYEISYIKE